MNDPARQAAPRRRFPPHVRVRSGSIPVRYGSPTGWVGDRMRDRKVPSASSQATAVSPCCACATRRSSRSLHITSSSSLPRPNSAHRTTSRTRVATCRPRPPASGPRWMPSIGSRAATSPPGDCVGPPPPGIGARTGLREGQQPRNNNSTPLNRRRPLELALAHCAFRHAMSPSSASLAPFSVSRPPSRST